MSDCQSLAVGDWEVIQGKFFLRNFIFIIKKTVYHLIYFLMDKIILEIQFSN